jgi:hypothetical protein
MPSRWSMAAVALLPCAALALTGCTKTVKASDAEAKIQRNLEGQMPSRTITVDCPGGKKAAKGTTFSCTVKIDGEASVADVRLVADDRFTFRIHSK